MLGKLSIIGAVAAILMIPTALSAQMGGAVSPGVHVSTRCKGWAGPTAATCGSSIAGSPATPGVKRFLR